MSFTTGKQAGTAGHVKSTLQKKTKPLEGVLFAH